MSWGWGYGAQNHNILWPVVWNTQPVGLVSLSEPARGTNLVIAVPTLVPLGGGRSCCCPCLLANPRPWGRAGASGAMGPRPSACRLCSGPLSFPWRWSDKEPCGPGGEARPVAAPPRPGGQSGLRDAKSLMAPLRSGVAAVRASGGLVGVLLNMHVVVDMLGHMRSTQSVASIGTFCH